MTLKDLEAVSAEMVRLQKRIVELTKCTDSAEKSRKKQVGHRLHADHYDNYKNDEGLLSCMHSKRRAAVKRAALDLRQELLRLTNGSR